jgi:hypothetical protein
MRLHRFTVIIPFFLAVIPVSGQNIEPIYISKTSEPVTLDGFSNELAWKNATVFPMVMYEPIFGAEPSEHTTVLAVYDEDYIYFAIRAYDSDPDRIRGNILFRDRFGSDDYFEVMIDTFNDNENALVFTTNPAGIRRDVDISRDATGPPGSWLNADFDTFWDVAAEVTDEGWFAEMRIPFSSLRFQDAGGRVIMGLSLHRIIVRKSERIIFPAIEPNVDRAFLKPSRMHKIVLDGVESQRPVYIRPYILGGLERRTVPGEIPGSFGHDHNRMAEAGLDLKYGLTNNLTLDLTANTDFAQAEADDQQVNLTRFSLFFPEKRQFFQERAGLFEFRTGGNSRLFHSRRIGLTDRGEMVRILGGARVVGRTGPWDIGFLNMQTDKQGELPSENFGALRLRRQIINPYSYAGGMAASRIGADGQYNLAYGLDGSLRLYGDDYLIFQWAHTLDKSIGNERNWSPAESGRFSGLFEKRLRDGFGYSTGFIWSGPDYNPRMGFIQRFDFTQFSQELSYTWRRGDDSAFIWHTLMVSGEAFYRNEAWEPETVQAGPEWSFQLKSGGQGEIGFQLMFENLLTPFFLDQDTYIPEGAYTFYQLSAGYTMSRAGLLRIIANAEAGSFFDGERLSVSFRPTWNVSPHLEIEGIYTYNYVRFPERDQVFNAHLSRMRFGIPFNTLVSVNIFMQYNSSGSSLSTNARFRYNFSEGNDLWIVYNEDLDATRALPIPEISRSRFRTFMIKYTRTFII